jgi:hypothetical protein
MFVRACISILMNFLLALTFLQAPFQHVHEHESTEHHPHGFIHTHFQHYRLLASKPAVFDDLDPDDDAHFYDWFATTVADHTPALFLETFSYRFEPAWSSEYRVESLILSGHDPPGLLRFAPRGPPV